MLSLFLSTLAFFVASYFLKRRFDELGFPKTIARGIVIFVVAMLVSYGVGFVVDMVASVGPGTQSSLPATGSLLLKSSDDRGADPAAPL